MVSIRRPNREPGPHDSEPRTRNQKIAIGAGTLLLWGSSGMLVLPPAYQRLTQEPVPIGARPLSALSPEQRNMVDDELVKGAAYLSAKLSQGVVDTYLNDKSLGKATPVNDNQQFLVVISSPDQKASATTIVSTDASNRLDPNSAVFTTFSSVSAGGQVSTFSIGRGDTNENTWYFDFYPGNDGRTALDHWKTEGSPVVGNFNLSNFKQYSDATRTDFSQLIAQINVNSSNTPIMSPVA